MLSWSMCVIVTRKLQLNGKLEGKEAQTMNDCEEVEWYYSS